MTVEAQTDFIRKIESLPPLPSCAEHIQTVTSAPNTSAKHIAKVLKGDPAVASRILRVVNSPFYGVRGEVTQITRAVVILGGRTIRNLVLGIYARNSLMPVGEQAHEHELLWGHSIATAALSERIARRIGFSPPEEAFLAGLLHDTGKLAMAGFDHAFFREESRRVASAAECLELEHERFGMNHAQAGHHILTRWGLPESFREVARRHHTTHEPGPDEADRLVRIVVAANRLAHVAGYGLDEAMASGLAAERSPRDLGLTGSDQVELLAELDTLVKGASEALATPEASEAMRPEASIFPRVFWVTPEASAGEDIGRAFLAAGGSDVVTVPAVDFSAPLTAEDVFMIDADGTQKSAADETAAALADHGFRRVVLLRETEPDTPRRRTDPATGVSCMPRSFTAYDLAWLGKQFEP